MRKGQTMKELLYNRSEAVAALNRVEGFNPIELARKIVKENQEEQLYLDVKYRKLWFRLVHPTGKIVSRIVNFTENMAIVEARIYLDKCDNDENYIANGFAHRFRSEDPQFGDKFLEMAETAATGRALADAGFGIQFADVGEANDPAQVDAGIVLPNIPFDTGVNEPVRETGWQSGNQMPQMQQPQSLPSQGMMNEFYQQAQANGNTVNVSAAQNYSAQQTKQANTGFMQTQPVQPQKLDASLPVEELVKQLSYEQAVQVLIGGNGKFGGKTMGQVAIESPSSLNWFATDFGGNNHLIPAAAKVILNKAMPMAG